MDAGTKRQMPRSFLALVFCVLISADCLAEPIANDQQYVGMKIGHYMDAFEKCNRIANERELPDEETQIALRRYPYPQVEIFLMARSIDLREQCEQPALGDLAYTILILEDAEISALTRESIEASKELIFNKNNWAFKKKYRELPADIRSTLEGLPYFQRPFDDVEIRKLLESPK